MKNSLEAIDETVHKKFCDRWYYYRYYILEYKPGRLFYYLLTL